MTLRTIGKYELLEEIGRGGFAVVYRARDTTLDRVVALKVLHPHWVTDPQFATRFRQEARAAANLRHPNIVTVHDTGEADGQLYIAMAYLPGRTLQDLLEEQGALSLEAALPILDQLADALDYAHGQGVIHRDVKPLNVMVEDTVRGPRATLMDFGLVKALESSTALTSQGTLLGSPEYMAPEQADPNRHAEIGPATDRYALGIVAYRMLAGRVPFPGNTPGTLNAHLNLKVPDPRDFVQDVPPEVTAALLTMLAKAPADRFPTASAFVTRLRNAQLAPLHTQLRAAAAQQDWMEVLRVGGQIQVLQSNDAETAYWITRVHTQLQHPTLQKPDVGPPPLAQRDLPRWFKPLGIGLIAVILLGVCIRVLGPLAWKTMFPSTPELTQSPAPTSKPTATDYSEPPQLPTQTPKLTATDYKNIQLTITNTPQSLTSSPQSQPSSTPANITTITASPLVAVTVEPTVQTGGLLSLTVNLVSQMGGASNVIAIQDNIAYLGEGPRLTILDLSDPTHPTRIAQTPVLSAVIRKIAASQTTVYAVVGDKRISIIDVADPKNPKVLGSYDDSSNTINDIAVEGDLAFVASRGLRIIDVSNPAQLAEIGFLDVGGTAVRIKGDYIYFASSSGFYVVDISAPDNPRQVGFVGFEPYQSASAIEIIDNLAYVSGSKFWTIDISNSVSPTIIASNKSTYANAIQVNGNYLYLSTNTSVQLIDIHHPTDPLLEGSYSIGACDIVRSENYVLVAECAGGMRVVDVSNATEPTEVGAYGLGAFGKETTASSGELIDVAIAVNGNYAYIAMDYCFQVVDISDPFHSQTVGILNGMPKFARQVAVDGNYAYVLSFTPGITVVDISDPTSPTIVKVLSLPKYTGSFVMGENYLYEISNYIGSNEASGMRVIDISDPANLAVVGTIIFEEDIYYGGIGGRFAYVASHKNLYVVDVLDPANPTVVTSQNRSVSGLTIRGNYAYFLSSEGLSVLDISDTNDIWKVGQCSAQNCGSISSILLISGNYALIGYLSYGTGLTTLADISDPVNPFASLTSLWEATGNIGHIAKGGVAFDGNYIYTVSGDNGFFILSISK